MVVVKSCIVTVKFLELSTPKALDNPGKRRKSMKIRAYAALTATSALAPYTIERRELRRRDVLIDIIYCGVCHSDIHQARGEWPNSIFPMVPGHEIVGRVAGVGTEVKKYHA